MSLRRAQNIFMPKNINSITINITLEGIEKIKTEKNDNRTVWTIMRAFTSWMAFIFPSMKIHNSWLEITKSCHSTLKNYRRHEVLKLIVQLLKWQFGIIGWTECVWLEAAKLTCTSPPAMKLLHAVFTSEASFERNGRLRMSEQARFCEAELSFLCRMSSFVRFYAL